MLFQSFSEASIKRVLRAADFFSGSTLRTIDDLSPAIAKAIEIANSENPKFESLSKTVIRNKEAFRCDELHDQLVLRKLNDTLRRVFKTKQSDRDYICRNTKRLLSEKVPFQVVKCDISSFYESVPREKLENAVASSRIFSPETKRVFYSVLRTPEIASQQGLPRGLSMSATLAEKYLESFDKTIKGLHQVYFYGRFVDDIIIFAARDVNVILDHMRKALNEIGLALNENKTRVYENRKLAHSSLSVGAIPKAPEFDFLGYAFSKPEYSKPAHVKIARSKINKFKTRIVRSFLEYSSDGDAALLEDRLRFLSGNYYIRLHSAETPLRAGIFYSYPLADSSKIQLKELDQFLKAQIFSRRNIPQRRGRKMTPELKGRLGLLSFVAGYEDRKVTEFTQQRISKMKSAWRDV